MFLRNTNNSSKGISLIEALIAMVVLAIGTLSIVKFQGEITSSGGLSKARSEAIQLAQDKIEELRSIATQAEYAALIPTGGCETEEDIAGTNANFDRTWCITTAASPPRYIVQVAVEWRSARGEDERVDLSTVITWDDPMKSASLSTGDTGGDSGFVKPPTGQGELVVDEVIDQETLDEILGENYIFDDSGLAVGEYNGKTVLIMEDGGEYRIVMRLQDDEDFSTIAGRVYSDRGLESLSPDDVFIVTSDAVFCTRYGSVAQLPSSGAAKYHYFNYVCYAGPGWYGNVGIVRTGNKDNQERVCLGDPTVSYLNVSTNRHPVLSTIRTYRGYEYIGGGWTRSIGIGMSGIGYLDYNPVEFSHHDFLLTRITGTAVDSSCKPRLEQYTPNPFEADASLTPPKDGNPGKFVCLTDTCPAVLPTGDPPKTVIKGSITHAVNNTDVQTINSMTLTSGSCPVLTLSENKRTYTYECEIGWSGWTGDLWSGEMMLNFAADSEICGFTLPDGDICEDMLCVVEDSGNTIEFLGVPPTVSVINLDITTAATGACP